MIHKVFLVPIKFWLESDQPDLILLDFLTSGSISRIHHALSQHKVKSLSFSVLISFALMKKNQIETKLKIMEHSSVSTITFLHEVVLTTL